MLSVDAWFIAVSCRSECTFINQSRCIDAFQTWTDEHLKWKPEDHDDITYIKLQAQTDIWVPDISIYNRSVLKCINVAKLKFLYTVSRNFNLTNQMTYFDLLLFSAKNVKLVINQFFFILLIDSASKNI